MVARMGLALISVQRGDVTAAEEHYAALETHRGTMMPWVGVSDDRLLGLLALIIGREDEAMDHLECAMTFCRKAKYEPELAWTCCDYADALLQRYAPGDRIRIDSLLEESLSISSELGCCH